MTYQEILAKIYALKRFGTKPGLARITALLDTLGNPQHGFATVHVVGTNGKGSTSSFLAAILAAGGHRTGLFTSPHLLSFTERIKCNSREISEDEVVSTAAEVMAAAPEGTTFFELVTAMAVVHFARQEIEVVVMEAGMGGGLDATSALDGVLTVITPVSLDHCEWLGSDLATIGREKSGIIKPPQPVVSALQPADAMAVIAAECQAKGSPLFREGVQFTWEWQETGLAYHGVEARLSGMIPGIAGRYQGGNAACALCAAELLAKAGFRLAEAQLVAGVEQARWPGRMELLGEAPRILLDGAHNPAGAVALTESLQDIPYNRLLLVIGVMEDKELESILEPLLPLVDEVFSVAPAIERAMSPDRLTMVCRKLGVAAVTAGPVARGLELAGKKAMPDDLVLVCGSLFTVGEARGIILSRTFEPFRG
jgi:dihydrofolate synthase/folylpolyglutamate synthase